MAPQTPTGSTTGSNRGATNEEMATQIRQLQQQIYTMYEQQQAQQNSCATKTYKMEKPNNYDGSRGTLQGYLTQCKAYFLHYSDQFSSETDKVMETRPSSGPHIPYTTNYHGYLAYRTPASYT